MPRQNDGIKLCMIIHIPVTVAGCWYGQPTQNISTHTLYTHITRFSVGIWTCMAEIYTLPVLIAPILADYVIKKSSP